jgi:K+ transporter
MEVGTVPNAMLHNLKHNKVLHNNNLFVTVRNHEVPWIGLSKRLEIDSLGHDCWQVVIHYGFKNDPDVPKALQQIKGRGCEMNTSCRATRWFPPSVQACRSGVKSCLRKCTTTPVVRPTS